MRASVWIACLALVASGPVASAQPRATTAEGGAESATRLRDLGNEAMLAMRYSDGLEYYRRASALAPDQAGLHYSMARAHQFLGEYPEALAELELFVKTASPDEQSKVARLDAVFADIRPRVATLDLRCNERGARVLLRDKVIGTTPLAGVRVPAGAASLQVELEGFFPDRRDVVLPGAGAIAVDVELHKKSTSALLTIVTDPIGAQIVVDGRARGTSNPSVEIALPAGAHDIVAQRPGYDDARIPIVLSPGAVRQVPVVLARSVPVTARWWFWTGLGAVVAGGVVLGIAATTERAAGHGSLTPGQIGAP